MKNWEVGYGFSLQFRGVLPEVLKKNVFYVEHTHGSKLIRFFPVGKRKLVLLISHAMCLWHSLSSVSFPLCNLFISTLMLLPWCVYVCVCAQSDSLSPCELQPTRILCPRDFPGKNTRVSCHFLLQGVFLTQGSNPRLLRFSYTGRQILYL